MPLAMARTLELPLVILTSIANCPLIHVTPSHFLGDFPLFLAYNQCGRGHYDMAKFAGDGKPDPEVQSIACRCG